MYLGKNNIQYRRTGEKRIEDRALAALCLTAAMSNPKE